MTHSKKDPIRLNVYLKEHGIASRRKADELIAMGAVEVDGKIVRDLGVKIEPDAVVKVNGKKVARPPQKVTYLFHKPRLTITSRLDERDRPTIFSLPDLAKLPQNVQSVGRLDYRSEGLLILTNDGELSLALAHPKFSVEKTYAVLVSTVVTAEEIDRLKKGVMLDDGLAKPLSVRITQKEKMGASVGHWVELVVTEGRNRLVRRMMEALGLRVIRLARVAIGDIRIPSSLAPGALRPISPAEKKYLGELKAQLQEPASAGRAASKKKGPLPTAEDLQKRKLKRTLSLNHEEYAKEAERRAAKASQLEQERKKKLAEKRAAATSSRSSSTRPTASSSRSSSTRSGASSTRPASSKPSASSRSSSTRSSSSPRRTRKS